MDYKELSKLRIPRRICSCAACGTKELLLVRIDIDMMFSSPKYCIEHEGRCKIPSWYTKDYTKINAAVDAWNKMNEELKDGFDRTWFEIDRVYETRWDCRIEPERVRRAA